MRPFGFIRFAIPLALSLGFYAAAPGGWTPARAESANARGIELISQATKAYSAGEYADAAASIEAAFKSGLTGELAARAILLRAQINEKSGALARALQDYSNALWMQSLPVSERKTATDGKERVMAAMGLSSSPPTASRQAAAPSAPPAGPQASSGGVFGMFDGLFGSSKASQPEQQPAAAPQKTWQTTTAAPEAASKTPAPKVAAVAPVRAAPAPKAAQATVAKNASLQPASASSVATSSGEFLIVFGSANSQPAAQTRAQQIKAQLSDILVNRNLDVEASPSGGFQIVAGPYKAKSAALALCSAMKQRGVTCQVTP